MDAQTKQAYQEIFGFIENECPEAGKGKVNVAGLMAIAGSTGLELTKKEAAAMIQEGAGKGKDVITLAQFIKMFEKKTKGFDKGDKVKDSFRMFDEEMKGTLPTKEMRAILTEYGEPSARLKKKDADLVTQSAVKDQDPSVKGVDYNLLANKMKAR